MALGVSTRRACPDQTKYEAARKSYIADALKPPKVQAMPVAAVTSAARPSVGSYTQMYGRQSAGQLDILRQRGIY